MCRADSFGERGIVRLHGYGSEHRRVEPDFAVPIPPRLGELGVLLKPASVLAKGVGPGGPRCDLLLSPAKILLVALHFPRLSWVPWGCRRDSPSETGTAI